MVEPSENRDGARPAATQRVLNVRLLLGTAIVLSLLAPTAYADHGGREALAQALQTNPQDVQLAMIFARIHRREEMRFIRVKRAPRVGQCEIQPTNLNSVSWMA